jgi:hypothetical protein
MSKTETVTIIIYPSGADADALTVSDAMQQVLDAFALLSRAEGPGSPQIVWRLERASTNSPLTVSALAESTDPLGDVDREARLAKAAVSDGLAGILHGRERAPWIDHAAEEIVGRVLRRTLNGIGRTDIYFGDDTPPIVIDHRSALKGTSFLEKIAAEEAALVEDLTHTEYGTIEGDVLGLTKHYRKPAVVIRARISGREIKCVLSEVAAKKIGEEHAWREAWTDQRVLVRGAIHYNSAGDIVKVDAESVEKIATTDVRAKELQSASGPRLASGEYLKRLWGD